MYIRIFSRDPAQSAAQFDKYLNFLRLETQKTQKKSQTQSQSQWTIEQCDPVTWQPSQKNPICDINLFVEVPVRLAVPWARFNVYAIGYEDQYAWGWALEKTEIDFTIPLSELTVRESALSTFRRMFRLAQRHSHKPSLPVAIPDGEKPKVGVITVTRNRKAWWINMIQNVVKQRWPVSRLEWILVDDGVADQRLRADVEEFMEKSPGIMIRYVELDSEGVHMTIGEKRNAGVKAAGDDVSVFVMMDDDDHYPVTSIENRVSWLCSRTQTQTQTQTQPVKTSIVYCSMLPMYDVTRYISAMNVPELTLPPKERVSEATLAFTREAWEAQPFLDVSMAEGAGFLEGRENESVEIPCGGVIVSFIHSQNTSSRRIPAEQPPNGCHYGFSDEFFKYIHTIGSQPQPQP